jgi:hypothetical protein
VPVGRERERDCDQVPEGATRLSRKHGGTTGDCIQDTNTIYSTVNMKETLSITNH